MIHPAIAVGALAAGLIPVLIHLWNRRRYRRVPWAAMRFLLAANRRSARRLWIERILLLLLRIAIITLFGLAIARPYVSASALFAMGESRVHRVILLDNSLSMNAKLADGRTRFDRAKDAALQLVSTFPQRDAVSLVTAASPGKAIIAYAAYDRRFVRETLADIEATQRMDDMPAALGHVLEIVRASDFPQNNKVVYVVSDFPRRAWIGDDGASATPVMEGLRALGKELGASAGHLTLVNASGAGAGPVANVAVTRLDALAPLIGVGLPVPLEIQVTNFGAEPVRNAELRIVRDGLVVRRAPLPHIEAEGTAVARVTTILSSAGNHVIEAQLARGAGDTLADDDVRRLSLEVRRATPVLLVDGRPGSTPLQGASGFLATALAPGRAISGTARRMSVAASQPTASDRMARVSPLEPKVIATGELATHPLNEYGAVILCNVSRLAENEWARLTRYVEDGGGLFVTLGDLVSAENYNRFGYADGAGVLPVRVAPAPVEGSHDGDAVGFSSEGLSHPVVATFAGHASSGLFLAHVDRLLPVEADPRRGEVILRFTTGAPALVLGSAGQGRVAVYATTANLSWNNLPAKGDFVSLMYNLVAHLAPHPGWHRNLPVGAPYEEALSAAQSALPIRVTDATGSVVEHALVPDGDTYVLRVDSIERAGQYRLSIGAGAYDLIANVDTSESDLTSARKEDVTAVLGRSMSWVEEPAGLSVRGGASEFAYPLLFCVALLLLMEVLAAMRFGSPVRRDPRGVKHANEQRHVTVA